MLGSGCGPEPEPTGVLLPSQARYRDQNKALAFVATTGDVIGSEPTIGCNNRKEMGGRITI